MIKFKLSAQRNNQNKYRINNWCKNLLLWGIADKPHCKIVVVEYDNKYATGEHLILIYD